MPLSPPPHSPLSLSLSFCSATCHLFALVAASRSLLPCGFCRLPRNASFVLKSGCHDTTRCGTTARRHVLNELQKCTLYSKDAAKSRPAVAAPMPKNMTAGYVSQLESCADCLSLPWRTEAETETETETETEGQQTKGNCVCVALALAASKSKFYQAKKGFELLPWLLAGFKFGFGFRLGFGFDGNGAKCYSRAFQVATFPAAFRRGHQNLLAAGAAFCSALVYTLVTRTYLQISI